MVKGNTASKLELTRDYDGKFNVGRNGLLEYNSVRARYMVGTIMYIDDFINKTTTFHYIPQRVEITNSIAAQFTADYFKQIESFIGFDRNNTAPFESVVKLALIENSDSSEFPNNFF
jgi:hypothetical protein